MTSAQSSLACKKPGSIEMQSRITYYLNYAFQYPPVLHNLHCMQYLKNHQMICEAVGKYYPSGIVPPMINGNAIDLDKVAFNVNGMAF